MKKCLFWSSEFEEKECFKECIMGKEANDGEECVFLEYEYIPSLEELESEIAFTLE